jgi:hypothetical protein
MAMLVAAAAPSAGPAAPTLSPIDHASLDRAIEDVFRPYSTGHVSPPWERPIWSSDMTQLIGRWRKVAPKEEADAASETDWLCQCQDWDSRAFKFAIRSRRLDAPGRANVTVRIDLMPGRWASARMLLRLEGGRWKLDDIVGGGFQPSLQAVIRRAIADDSKQ